MKAHDVESFVVVEDHFQAEGGAKGGDHQDGRNFQTAPLPNLYGGQNETTLTKAGLKVYQ